MLSRWWAFNKYLLTMKITVVTSVVIEVSFDDRQVRIVLHILPIAEQVLREACVLVFGEWISEMETKILI